MNIDKKLTKTVKLKAKKIGAKLVGIAAAERFKDAPEGWKPEDILPGAKNVIVFGVPLLYSIIHDLRSKKPHDTEISSVLRKYNLPNREYTVLYVNLNQKMEQMAIDLAYFLEEKGYKAIPIAPSAPLWQPKPIPPHMDIRNLSEMSLLRKNNEPPRGELSQRHAAVLAGLGQFGLSNLVLTPEYGPRIRFASIITNAPLEPDNILDGILCKGKQDPKKCQACIKACPSDAFQKTKTHLKGILDYNEIDKWNCLYYCRDIGRHIHGSYMLHGLCGICIKVCPIGMQPLAKRARK